MTVCAYSTRFRHLEAGECLCQPARKRKRVRAEASRPGRGERAGHARTRLVTPGRRRSARDAVPFVLPRTRPGEREGSSPPRLGGTRHAARVTFPRAEIMFKRLFGAEKSGGGSAPSAGSTGGGGGGKTTPLGAVEQLKDVRHPRSNPRGCLFFGNPTAPRVPCAVARRKASGRSRNVAFSFLFCQKPTLFSSLSAPLGASRSRTRVRASSSHATLTPRHSLRDTRSAPPAPPPSRRPSPCWRSARRCCTRRWRRS